ncbi:MAG: hypothetical protein M1444_03015 [Patescibacteria group bacterium]|nr:hypothetical protein [Patescibacteria group bacterium]
MSFSRKFTFSTFIIAVIYILLVVYLRNLILVNETFFSSFSILARLKLYGSLLLGMTTSMAYFALFLMLVTALLTGLNITLVIQRVNEIQKMGKVHFVTGGSTLLGLVGGGCASCGLPVISLLGLSQSLLFLPFKGAELPYISIFLLLFSLYFLIKSSNKAKTCELK